MRISVLLLSVVLFFSGCATTLRKSQFFEQDIQHVKKIAVMPPDISVYRLTAGGVKELIYEWSDESKKLVKDALKKYLGQRYGFKIKFVSEDWLKNNYKELWQDNQALYNAISNSVLFHAYPGPNAFSSKLKNFDYTLGKEVFELAKVCDADALLFIYGVDHEATAGRVALLFWNIIVGVATGVVVVPLNPSIMSVGLVEAKSGNLEWFKVSPPQSEYSFRNKKSIDTLVEWLTRDFILKE